MRLVRAGVAVLFAVAAAGCALSASPADGLIFHAPPGWHSSPGIMGFMQFWRPPNNDREVLVLFKSPRPLKESEIFSGPGVNDTMKNTTVERRQDIVICGHQPAVFIEARGQSSRGTDTRAEMVMSTVGTTTYFALYARPLGSPPNQPAQAALRELCPKP